LTTATLYTDQTKGTVAANPVSTDSYGNLSFYAVPGIYVLSFSVGGIPSTKTVPVIPWYADSAWNTYITTNNVTPVSGDCVLANAGSGEIGVFLPAPAEGTRIKVAKTDSSGNLVVLIAPSGVITGVNEPGNTQVIIATQGGFLEVFGDGTNYRITAGLTNRGVQAIALLGVNSLAGTPPPPGVQAFFMMAGSSTATTNANGEATIAYPGSFPTHAATVVGCYGATGMPSTALMMDDAGGSPTGFNISTGTNAALEVRVNWIAIGF
jgi:hypothetical protein